MTRSRDEDGTDYGTKGMPPKHRAKPILWTDGVQTLTAMGNPNSEGDLLAPGNTFSAVPLPDHAGDNERGAEDDAAGPGGGDGPDPQGDGVSGAIAKAH